MEEKSRRMESEGGGGGGGEKVGRRIEEVGDERVRWLVGEKARYQEKRARYYSNDK